MSKVTCPTCKKRFKSLGTHWQHNPNHRVSIGKEKLDTLTGILMGDGTIRKKGNRNPYMSIRMINRQYLEYLDSYLDWLTSGVDIKSTARELAAKNVEKGFDENADADNYHDLYRVRTISHPDLHPLHSWVTDGGKRFPDNLELNPTILKHWYVCDGGLRWGDAGNAISAITSVNESDRVDYLLSLFDDVGFNVVWDRYASVRLSVHETDKFLKYIGEPPPGFSYKWENKRKNVYKRKKEEAYEQGYESPQTTIQDW